MSQTSPANNQETVDAIKLMILGSLIAEYGARLLIDETKMEMKMRCKGVINSVRAFENYFLGHPNCSDKTRAGFKKDFNKNETVLLAELNLLLWPVKEDDLEEILKSIKQVIDNPENVEP